MFSSSQTQLQLNGRGRAVRFLLFPVRFNPRAGRRHDSGKGILGAQTQFMLFKMPTYASNIREAESIERRTTSGDSERDAGKLIHIVILAEGLAKEKSHLPFLASRYLAQRRDVKVNVPNAMECPGKHF